MNVRALRPFFSAFLLIAVSATGWAQTTPESFAALHRQAERGNAIAQYNLGLVYADPDESFHDRVQAYIWLSRAAANGSRSRELDRLADELTPAQLRAARAQLNQSASVSITPVDFDEAPAPARVVSADPELRKRLAIAESALAVRERDLAALRAELDQANQAKALDGSPNATAEIDFLRTQLATSTADVASLRDELASAWEQLNATEQARQQSQTELAQTKSELSALSTNDELSAVTDRLSATQAQIQALNEEVTSARRAQGRLQAELAESRQAVNDVNDVKADAELLSFNRDQRAEQLESALAQVEQLKLAGGEQNGGQQTEIIQLRQQLAYTQTRSLEADQQIGRLNISLKAATQNQAQLENSLNQRKAESARIATDLTTAQADLAQARLASSQQDSNAEVASEELTAIVQQRDQLQAMLSAKSNQVELLRADFAQSSAAADILSVVQNENTQFTTELAYAREQLAAVASQRDQLQAILTAQANPTDDRPPAIAAEIIQLRQQLTYSTGEIESLQADLAANATASENLQVAQNEIARLDSELTASRELAAQTTASNEIAAASETDANQEKLSTTLRAFASVEAELNDSRRALTAAEENAQAYAKTIADLEARLANLQPTLAAAEVAAANAESSNNSTASALAETRNQLTDTQADLDRISREFATFRASQADQYAIAETLAAQNADLSTQVRQTQEQYAEASRELADIRTRYALSVTNDVPNIVATRATPGRPTPRLSANVRTHTVAAGDSLTNIAQQYLGDAERWPEIYALNRDTLSTTNGVRRGMVLRIP
jgi:chromosome segregation ATPase